MTPRAAEMVRGKSLRHLQDAIVLLEMADDGTARCTPAAYRFAAITARKLVWAELRRVPVQEFHATVETLHAIADNLYFESRGRFAEVDGSGLARSAQQACEALLSRLRTPGRRPCAQG